MTFSESRRPGRLLPCRAFSVARYDGDLGLAVHAVQVEPRSYRSSLDPETLAAAQDAFDLAWPEIEAAGGHDLQLARNLLARLIVEAAMEGERDPERLKNYALEGFKQ